MMEKDCIGSICNSNSLKTAPTWGCFLYEDVLKNWNSPDIGEKHKDRIKDVERMAKEAGVSII